MTLTTDHGVPWDRGITSVHMRLNISEIAQNPNRLIEIVHEIFSMAILSLPLIQEVQLSVTGEKMGTCIKY